MLSQLLLVLSAACAAADYRVEFNVQTTEGQGTFVVKACARIAAPYTATLLTSCSSSAPTVELTISKHQHMLTGRRLHL